MSSTKIILGIALIAFCCISMSYSIKCYVCEDKKSCNRPQKFECNPMLANNTRAYLLAFHKGVSVTATSPFYDCFREYIETRNTLKCFVCNSKESCKKPQLYQCDQMLANATRTYLLQFHSGVNLNATSNSYNCFREYLATTSNDVYYKGCTYSNVYGCKLPLSPYMSTITKKQECLQCSNRDGCNPAGRVSTDVMTVLATSMIAVALRCVWH